MKTYPPKDIGVKDIEQCSTFTPEQLEALLLLKTHIHHKDLKVRAGATTKTRIEKLLELKPHTPPELITQLWQASAKVTEWVYGNKAALYKFVYKVTKRYANLVSSHYYHEEELFNILFLESLRIMYNYDPNNAKGAEPLTYLIATLKLRVNSALYLSTPYSMELDAFDSSDYDDRCSNFI